MPLVTNTKLLFANGTTSLLPTGFSSWTWLVLGDMNSRVGSVVSAAIGDHGAEVENIKGAVFHEWLLLHRFWLPQTFSDVHHG